MDVPFGKTYIFNFREMLLEKKMY